MRILLLSLVLFFIFSCGNKKLEADLLVYNAKIYTVDDGFTTVEAFVVREGRIVELGNQATLEKKYAVTSSYDAEGHTIVPGLIDAHAHLYGLGLSLQAVDLVGTKSFEEVIAKTEDFQKTQQLAFITGRGWNQNLWEGKEFPTKSLLDKAFPDVPVVLKRIDGHALIANQKAIDLAGVTSKTKVEGGEILVMPNGELSGVFIDKAMDQIQKIVPKPEGEISVKALLDAEKVAVSYGLTTVNDAGLDREIIERIDSLQKAEAMQIRINAMISNTSENLDYYLDKGIYKTEKLNVRSFKIFTDGALGSRGAAMKNPYTDRHDHYGLMITPPKELKEIAHRIAKTDYQINSHAIGDSANAAVLRAYAEALDKLEDKRWRVEHAQIISPEDFDFYRSDHNIIPSIQPTHATSDMEWAEKRIGAERIKGAYAYKTLLNKAGILALGTDFPVEEVNPMYTFYAAVARKDLQGFPADGFQKNEALSREEALKGMTIWAAYANFEENEKGSLEKHKFADFTILDKDLMTIAEEELPNIKVLATFIDGKQVYGK